MLEDRLRGENKLELANSECPADYVLNHRPSNANPGDLPKLYAHRLDKMLTIYIFVSHLS